MVVRDVLPRPSRTSPSATPRFNLVGVHWQGTGMPWFRTRERQRVTGADGSRRTTTAEAGRGWRQSSGTWTGAAEAIQWGMRGQRVACSRVPPVEPAVYRARHGGCSSRARRRSSRARAGTRTSRSCARSPKIAPDAEARGRSPHRDDERVLAARSRRRSSAGSRSTTSRETAGTTSATTFSSTRAARSSKGAGAGSSATSSARTRAGSTRGTVGVSMIGNFERATPSQAQQDALVEAARVAARRRARRSALDRRRSSPAATRSSAPAGR